jgi:two-component system sensor histidine kinase/response regulator
MKEAPSVLRHKLLARQVKRHLGLDAASWEAAQQELTTLAASGQLSASVAQILSGLAPMLEQVGEAYQQHDRDLELKARSLDLSSADLTASNSRLRDELESRTRAMAARDRNAIDVAARSGPSSAER